MPITVNYTLDDLRDEGYEAIFIAAGAQKPASRYPWRTGGSGRFSLRSAFLRDVKVGKPIRIGRRVAIIGGGNVALDTARTAMRLGAEAVTIYYRRSGKRCP